VLEVSAPTVAPQGDGTFRVSVTLTNSGYLPTSLTDRGAVGEEMDDGSVRAPVVRPPWAVLEVAGAEIVDGTARRAVGHIAGSNPYLKAVTATSRTVTWVVRPTGGPASIRVVAGADKGGVRRTGVVNLPMGR
jgi:hypothetical protein